MSDAAVSEPAEVAAVERAFGEANRRRILEDYFETHEAVSSDNAWQHVYQLLLWINPTISLAHCYESDKCQPHKAWYPRSLAFHAWVSEQFGVHPTLLHEDLDWLFRSALPELAHVEVEARRSAALKHLSKYAPHDMPLPGDDAELIDVVRSSLGPALDIGHFDEDRARTLVEQIYGHFAQENKRKNLLGRGFEDTLRSILLRLPGTERWEVRTRVSLGDVPGFASHGAVLKRAEIDLALWERTSGGRRILVSAKWSVRADRERQFESDFRDYVTANSGGLFEYVLITNEFDAARLDAACTKVSGNQYLFERVVHVNPVGVLVAYGSEANQASAGSARGRKARQLRGHLETQRLMALESWLRALVEA